MDIALAKKKKNNTHHRKYDLNIQIFQINNISKNIEILSTEYMILFDIENNFKNLLDVNKLQ